MGVAGKRLLIMKSPVMTSKKRSLLFVILAFVSFCACFIFAPLGSFMVWIFGGAFVYLLFMSIYSLIPEKTQHYVSHRFDPRYTATRQSGGRRMDPQQAETKEYIKKHMTILVTIFVAGISIVLAILMMFL